MMSAKNVQEAHERRLTVITGIAMEVDALNSGGIRDEQMLATDSSAEKFVYAKAYQAWADCRMEGTAEDIFEAIQEVLDI